MQTWRIIKRNSEKTSISSDQIINNQRPNIKQPFSISSNKLFRNYNMGGFNTMVSRSSLKHHAELQIVHRHQVIQERTKSRAEIRLPRCTWYGSLHFFTELQASHSRNTSPKCLPKVSSRAVCNSGYFVKTPGTM